MNDNFANRKQKKNVLTVSSMACLQQNEIELFFDLTEWKGRKNNAKHFYSLEIKDNLILSLPDYMQTWDEDTQPQIK